MLIGRLLPTQTCNESSIKVFSTIGFEAWRQGYNPVDYHTSKATGIITPATPGRYKLKVATEAEPTPVESESFVLPCSQISNLKVICNPELMGDKTDVSFEFVTGEGGALDAGNSIITIHFPEEFKLPEKISNEYIMLNAKSLTTNPQINQKTNTITFVSPVNIDNLGDVKIEFKIDSKILSPAEVSEFTFGISTSSEPELVEFTGLVIPPEVEFWNKIPSNVKKRILQYEKLPVSVFDFDREVSSKQQKKDFQELLDNLLWAVWGTRPEIHMNFERKPWIMYQPLDVYYLLAYHKKDGTSPTAFLGPDCCHYEPGFSADDPFHPRQDVIYPGFGTIYPYCDVMIKSWRRCSNIQCEMREHGSDYMMVIVGGDQCASTGCKTFREEHDVYFLFLPAVSLETEYTKTFARFSEVYPEEFKPMLPAESRYYTDEAGAIFLFEHNWEENNYKLSAGKTPGNIEKEYSLSMDIPRWNLWLDYVFHMKRNGR